MRKPIAAILISLSVSVTLAACGGVDDPPLGGPFGGTTDPTGPNGGNGDPNNGDPNNNNNDPGNDAGSTQTQDSGGTQTQDSGTQTKDSGTQTQDSGQQQQQNAPTWTQVFNDYLKSGTKGKCSSCHSQGNSASGLYTWLKGRGYINGTSSALVDANQSCLSWYGGNMPTSGPSSYAAAVTDMNAWAAAGAQNN